MSGELVLDRDLEVAEIEGRGRLYYLGSSDFDAGLAIFVGGGGLLVLWDWRAL